MKNGDVLIQSYPPRVLDRRLQEAWARATKEGPRVLMNLRSTKFRALLSLSLHSSPSSSKLLSMASYGVASPLSLFLSPFRYHSSSKKQRNPLMKKILSLQAPMELTSCGIRAQELQSLSKELRDYYEERHRSHLRPHSHRREKERKPQEANINLSYFHGKDNVEANLDWEIRVEQQLKKKSTSKSYGSHSYPKKDQGVTPSKPKDDKGKAIEKQAPKASMQEKTSSIKCFKCLGRGHITSQCPTTKTMIMRGQDIYSSQDEATTSPSSSESEEAKWEESSEEIYPQEDGQPLVVKEKCKEVSVSSKRLAKKETHFTIKTNIKEIFPLRQPPHFLFCKKTLASIATPLGLEFIPQVKKLLDEGLVRKSLNPCALLVPKIGTHMGNLSDQGVPMNSKRIKVILEWPTPPSIRKIWGFHDLTNFYKRFQSSFRAQNFVLFYPSPFIHLLLPPSSYPWPPMVTPLLLEVASPPSLPFSIPLPFIFQEAKESIDEEDPRPTSSNGAYIMKFT
ncbi:hypothetical protein HKD37_14G039907 [Glycine soja]